MTAPASPRYKPKRLLFIAEAVTLAHVARAHVVAEAAAANGYDVIFCAHSRYNSLFGQAADTWKELYTIPEASFAKAIAYGRPIYDEQTLARYVEDDLQLIQTYMPDAIIGDFRLSLSASARLCGVPYATITNAYWSPYAAIRYPIPDIPITSLLGRGLAQPLFDLFRPAAFALHAVALNRVRKSLGLAALPYDLRHAYTDADLVLYADLAELVPVKSLPNNHRFIGPILWAPKLPLPEWWNALPTDKPLVYVNLGSSGYSGALPAIIDAIASLGVTAIIARGRSVLPNNLPANVRVASYLPGDRASEQADLVINNGGSPGCYQSLAAGRPVLGVCHNMDQFLNMSLVAASGAGRLVSANRIYACGFREALENLLMQNIARQKADELKRSIRSTNGSEMALLEIARLLG